MMEKKNAQKIMVWFLPLIIFGGLFYPPMGYLVFLMMLFFLVLAYFKGRLWCSRFCPRGSFLDLVLSQASLKRQVPRLFLKKWFRWVIFAFFIAFFIFRLATVEKTFPKIGFVFVQMCLLSTLVAIALGIFIRERAWCVICPMGTLQGRIGAIRSKKK